MSQKEDLYHIAATYPEHQRALYV